MARKKGPVWNQKRKQLLTAQNRVEAAQRALAAAIKTLANVVKTDPGDGPGIRS